MRPVYGRVLRLFLIAGLVCAMVTPPEAHGAETSLLDGLRAYYPFDGGAEDWSGNGNHGTVVGATLVPDRFGSPAGALRFGGNHFVSAPDSPTLDITDEISVSVWVRMDRAGTTLPVSQYLISKGTGPYFNTSRNAYSLFLGDPTNSSASITFELSDGAVQRHYTADAPELRVTALAPAVWYHLAATWDGTRMRLYLDGVHIPDADASFAGPINSTPGGLNIGRLGDGSAYFQGTMDELRIYDRALAPEEVYSLFIGRLDCVIEAQYTREDLEEAFREGYAAGLADAGVVREELCSSFDGPTGILRIPCLDLGDDRDYWANLLLLPSDPILLELQNFGIR